MTISELTEMIAAEKAILVYFFSDDCAPCISLRPKIEMMLKDFPRMKLKYMDSKNYPEIAAAYGVFSNPVIILFFEGKEFKRFSKYVSVEEIKSSISRIYSILFGADPNI